METFRVMGLCLLLVGCNQTPLQVQTNQAQIQADIVSACGQVQSAMSLAAPLSAIPQVGAVMDYGAASCIGSEAIAALVTKAVNDPNTIVWTQNLAKTISGAAKAPIKLM
jgi:hypothetical protein